MRRHKRKLIIGATVIGAMVLIAATLVAIKLRDGTVKHRVTQALSEHLKSDVTINTLSVRLFPTVRVIGSGLVIRRRSDPADRPPMITAVRFVVKPGLWHLLRGRAREVEMEGLRFTIPKRPAGRTRIVEGTASTGPAEIRPQPPGRRPGERATLETLIARDAELIYVSSRPGGPVRIFKVPSLELTDVSFDAPMEFKAALINPLPRGRLDTSGLFGPFDPSDPGSSNVEGSYAFADGDFNGIRGLSGTVTSRGLFSGQLDQMAVDGTTTTDNFQLDASTHALPLHTTFRAVVDGTDGDIRLTHVEARLAESAFTATGTITGTPGVRGRRIAMDVEVPAGRVEDFLKLALPASRPMMAGDVTLVTSFVLPPGDTPALSRMELNGKIGLTDAHFSSRATAAKIAELSRRGRGKSSDAPPERALMGLSGQFKYARGVARFSSLRFHTPGAAIALSGSYTLQSGAMNFSGTVTFEAKISTVVGGVKGFFLKVADPLFRDNGQKGSTVPITITGTHGAPKTSVSLRRVFGGQSP
jgi:hypothetical protein